MKLQSSVLRHSLFVLIVILALPAFRAAAQSKPDAAEADEKQSKAQRGLKPMPHDEDKLESVQEGAEFLKRRQDWFFQPRAFPLGFIPQGARQRAMQRMQQMLQNEGRLSTIIEPGIGLVTPPGPTGTPWQFIGPQATSSLFPALFTSGRVTALAVNPNNANNVYLGAADGGLWVTTDAGMTWTALTDFQPAAPAGVASIAVGSLAVDPFTCGPAICTTVYVGTGEDNFGGDNLYGEGVLRCTVTAGTPPTASCTQDSTFHTPSPLDQSRGGPLIGALAINPRTSGSTAILLAGVRGRGTALPSGIYCSANAGATWAAVFGISGILGTDAVFASDGTAFVALGFPAGDAANNGIYKSRVPVSSCTAVTDAANTTPGGTGSKWIKQSLPAGTPAASLGRIALGILPISSSTGSNATVYAAIADSTTTSSKLLGVIKTTNGGTSWTQPSTTTPAFCNDQCFYDLVIGVDPADTTGRTVFAGGANAGTSNTLIRSTDGGTTWTEVAAAGSAAGLHVDTHALAFSANGSALYVGNDGGVWSTTGPTASTITWKNLNASLGITQLYPGISIHPSTPLSGLGGTQDNDLQQYLGSLVWQSQNIGCDGGFTAIDPGIPSTIYGECEYLPNTSPFPIIAVSFTGDQLGNGFVANAGINNADRGSFIPPFVLDVRNPQTLYFGTCRVWQTKDGANTWTAISPDVTTSAHPAGCPSPSAATSPSGTLTTIAPAPSNSSTVYAGADNGEIEVTADGGTTWTSIVTAALPTRAVTQIAVDPSNAAIAYATFSGFGTCAVGCTGPTGHVFKTVNGTAGAATVWTDIDGSVLPDIPVNAIVIDPDDLTHNTLYVGTDIGAFFTTTAGTTNTWSVLGAANSLPPSEILGLALHDPSRTLRAATHGRGVWDLNLGGQALFGITSIAPFTANAGAASQPLTVNGNGFTSTSVVNFAAGGVTTPLATSCATAATCTATIPTAQLLNGTLAQITVTNSGSTTNAVPFTVLNPIPGITSISPTTVPAGSSGLTLTVNGSNFLTGATLVQFNTISLPASAVTVTSPTTLTVQVPAANLATAQTVSVDTFNPQPGGGPDINPTPPTLAITGGTTTTTVTSSTLSISSGGSVTLTATVATTSHGVGPTGTVQFKNGANNLSAAVSCVPTAGTTTATAFCTATLTVALSFLTPPGVPHQMPPFRPEPMWIVASTLLILYLLSLKRLAAAKRIGFACAGLLLFACAVAGIAGCGGGSGSGVTTHTDSVTAVYSGDTIYSPSTSAAISISVH